MTFLFKFSSLDPDNERIVGNLYFYRDSLHRMKTTGEMGDSGTLDDSVARVVRRSVSKQDEWKERKSHMDYEKLCRGETRKLVSITYILIYFADFLVYESFLSRTETFLEKS